jgi:RNA polymerase sigma-70 factor (ECF subfamily)
MSGARIDVTNSSGDLGRLIEAARGGDAGALEEMLERCRQYLLLVANLELPDDLRAKVGASDLVQETWIEAHRDVAMFRGRSEAELIGWLRGILLHNLANAIDRYRNTAKRDVAREVALGDAAAAGAPADGALTAPETPSREAMVRERDDALRLAIERLPETYRQVIQWRNYERCPFEEIGQRLGRSAEAARKLWTRALEQLRQDLGELHDSV